MQNRNLSGVVLAVVVAGLLAGNLVGAVPLPLPPAASVPEAVGSISVSGSSAIRVQPDRVVLAFGVEAFAATPRAAQEEVARLSRSVLAAIRAQGIADKEIATDHFVVRPEYDTYASRRKVVGYWALNSVAVTLRDVDKLEPVLVAALEAGASTVDGIEFSVSNLRELRDQARELAVRAAREKAAAMAQAAGMDLGYVTQIAENSWHYGYRGSGRQWTNYQNVVQELASEGAITLEDGSISLGQIVVKAEVSLSAELVPAQ